MSACITAPPPDLPNPPLQGPTIQQSGVQPPTNQDLTALPDGDIFIVPVVVGQPSEPFFIKVFVDFNPGSNNANPHATPATKTFSYPVTPATLDGGVYAARLMFGPDDLGDPNACHWIEAIVADSFVFDSDHTPMGRSDSVFWHYVPDTLNGCLLFDAGPFQDGAFPDAPPDHRVTPGVDR